MHNRRVNLYFLVWVQLIILEVKNIWPSNVQTLAISRPKLPVIVSNTSDLGILSIGIRVSSSHFSVIHCIRQEKKLQFKTMSFSHCYM